MFGVFLTLLSAVLNCVRATSGLPADRAPVYRGCPCRGPTGVPTDTEAGWYQGQRQPSGCCSAAATAETASTAACVVRVRSTYIGQAFTNKKGKKAKRQKGKKVKKGRKNGGTIHNFGEQHRGQARRLFLRSCLLCLRSILLCLRMFTAHDAVGAR